MTIATRLIVLLTVPLLALLGLGVFTRLQVARLEARSRFVAESRIVALATIGNLSRSFSELRVNVRTHLLATDDAQRARARALFDEDEGDLSRLLREYADGLIVDSKGRRLLDDYQTLSRAWIADAKQAMRLANEGHGGEAVALVNGTVNDLGVRLSKVSNEWIAYDEESATAAGRESITGIERFQRQMLVANSTAFLAASALGLLTFRRIVQPIRALEASVKTIAGGDYERAVPFVGAPDETGGLARSIDVLKQGAAAMDAQRWVKSNVTRLSGELQAASTRAEFGQRLLSGVMPLLGGGIAGFYVFDEALEQLQPVAAYGLVETSEPARPIRLGEGLVGLCARERQAITLTNLPRDYFRIASGLGQATPLRATALPALSTDALLGVLEVASFSPLNSQEQSLLDELLPVVALSLEVLERNLRTEELLGQTQAQERQLQRVNFLADSALDLTKSGYWHVPLDGSGWYNSSERAARIFGDVPNADYRYTLEHWAEHVRLGDEAAAATTMENFTAAVEGKIPVYDTVYAYKRPIDGRVVWIHAAGHVVKDASGKPADMFGVTQDITDYKLLQTQLVDAKHRAEEATEMKSMFLANMSHEIRTPMNAIIGLSHLALKTQLSAKQRDYVGKIHNAGTSLLAVINDILDFSKIEAGRLDVEAIDFKLDEVISSVTTLTAQKAHEKGLEFLVHVAPGIPELLVGDPLRLGQILTNCVNNAVKFTERGEIRLSIELLERTGEKVQLKFAVRDTGIGMTREQSEKLFQPFQQADMSTTRKHGGTGLGLTISRRLVELMGGRIWLESEAGVGTTFYFTVWVGVSASKVSGRMVPEKLARLRVLVVDDNAAAREILQEPLSALASRVDVVASGKEAITAVQQHDTAEPYDIVFMDWRMPGMDGLQASRHIKSDETLSHRPAIVLVTAFGREEVREEAERLQLDGFLVKPVTKSMIVDTLVNVFAHGAEETSRAAEGEQATPLRGARILLTEDNEINQQIAVELLEGAGATIEVANNGREAVEILSANPQPPFDVVLMDLQMPEMDGYQATAKLRSDARFAHLPIIAMTAHATIEERQRCLAAGMNDHIAKPIDPRNLYETVARFYTRLEDAAPATAGARPEILEPPRTDDADGLPSIAGLDAKDGLSRVGGNRKLYLKLLRQFIDQQGPSIAQVTEALANGDIALAERLAHSLKGVAGNIGATPVRFAAGDLEKLIHDRAEAKDVEAAKEQLAARLGPLVTELRSALEATASHAPPPSAVPTPADSVSAREAAARLRTLLSDMDPGAADFVEVNHAPLRLLFDDAAWSAFERLVQDYAFADAQAQLEQALECHSAV